MRRASLAKGSASEDEIEKTPHFRAGLSKLTAMGFQRLAVNLSSNLGLKIQKATAPR
ncbi:hypothetical protein [Bradyrhizobium sp. WSM2254]|uniref:hypothetical protein n=1 Tax=Bradyrhizobium sp. WSM2254 TaxID=1188263 RepID=UPI0018DE4DE1|nr:hypothetical protein [Bradyrhizobium sp. WSM2254]